MLKLLFASHSIPVTVRTDNGPQLLSEEFKEFSREWKFSHVTSSPYYAHSNGKATSAVKIAKSLLQKAGPARGLVVSASASVLVGPRVRLSSGSHRDLINWCCSLLTRRTVCGRAAGNTPRTQKQTEWSESRNCTNSVLALQDHCSYKAPTTNHHIKQKNIQNAKRDGRDISLCLLEWRNVPTQGLDSSPCPRLMFRRTRSLVPLSNFLLKQQVIDSCLIDKVQTHETLLWSHFEAGP